MIDSKTKFAFSAIVYTTSEYIDFWDGFYKSAAPTSKFNLDIASYFKKNTLVSRSGFWPSPWEYEIPNEFKMPTYKHNFNKTFEDVTDQKALEIKSLIQQTGRRVAIYYSGGIDSTLTLTALLKNLQKPELDYIDVGLSSESIIENPSFYEKHIHNKLNIFDSSKVKYSDIIDQKNYAITSDLGDSIFGTELALIFYKMYNVLSSKLSTQSKIRISNLQKKISDSNTHYSEYADMLILFFNLERNPNFGQQFYEYLNKNIQESEIPIVSLHDFFWWYIFNLKYLECAFRSSIYYCSHQNVELAINKHIINWFNTVDYQNWSMVNNNNSSKIDLQDPSPVNYKKAARNYIYQYDKNDWYFRYKSKLSSMKNILMRDHDFTKSDLTFALTSDYKRLYLHQKEVQNFISTRFSKY